MKHDSASDYRWDRAASRGMIDHLIGLLSSLRKLHDGLPDYTCLVHTSGESQAGFLSEFGTDSQPNQDHQPRAISAAMSHPFCGWNQPAIR